MSAECGFSTWNDEKFNKRATAGAMLFAEGVRGWQGNCSVIWETGSHFRVTRSHFQEAGGDPFLEFLAISWLKFHILSTWWV